MSDCDSKDCTKLQSNTSYEYFYNEFMVKNIPCIFSEELTRNWKCRQHWVTNDGKPDLNLLNQLFGKALVSIANCDHKYFNSNPTQDMCFSQYLNYWQTVQQNDYRYQQNNLNILYLKDWHFVRQFNDYNAYETPLYFESDWLNEFCDQNLNDDYRFVYMGPKGSWTPLHTDVFGSFSWSANICGKKKWLLIPASSEDSLKQICNNDLAQNFYLNSDYLSKLTSLGGIEVIQNSGEIIFIPSGWIHQVFNIEDCISINHNWFNASNIHFIWHNIVNSFIDVENELSDLKSIVDINEWNFECSKLFKSHHGIDFGDFFKCLSTISQRINIEFSLSQLSSTKVYFRLILESKVLIEFLKSIISSPYLYIYKSDFKNIIDLLSKYI